MLDMSDLDDLPLRMTDGLNLAALRVEGAAPTTIEAYRSVLASYLRSAALAGVPSLASFTLMHVRASAAYLMGENVRIAHHQHVRARGRLSDHTIKLHGRCRGPSPAGCSARNTPSATCRRGSCRCALSVGPSCR